MHDVLVYHLLHGGVDSPRPWAAEEKVTFVCPVPGYDRHFTMLASYGIDMVTVPMVQDGPDVAAVEALVKDDPSIKGMWIVPDVRQPGGLGDDAGGRGAAGRDARRGPRLPPLLGQRLRLPPPHRGGGEVGRHPLAGLGGREPAPSAWCSRRRARSPSPGPGSPSWPPRGRTSRGTSTTSSTPRSGPTRSTTCGTCSSSAPPRACATTWTGTAPSSRRSSPRWTRRCLPSWTAWGSRSGPGPAGATSSASTCSTAAPRAWSSSRRRPASS